MAVSIEIYEPDGDLVDWGEVYVDGASIGFAEIDSSTENTFLEDGTMGSDVGESNSRSSYSDREDRGSL
ncbi:MAG: hypothetical protein GWQ08_16865 [Verrucomicrobiaceae bacterium]|nr:hypothetical protein [Verrucomicrobiaceae bacterium]